MNAEDLASGGWSKLQPTARQRAEVLRRNLDIISEGPMRGRLSARLAVLEEAAGHLQAQIAALPFRERAPALWKWAQLTYRRKNALPLQRAAAWEVFALAFEESGSYEQAEECRRQAAALLGVTPTQNAG